MKMRTEKSKGYMVGVIIAVLMGVAIASVIAMNTLKKSEQVTEHANIKKGSDVLKIAATLLMEKTRDSGQTIDQPPAFTAGWCGSVANTVACGSATTPLCEDDKNITTTSQCPPPADTSRYPANGWVIPVQYGGPQLDVYGKRFGYCAWNWNLSTAFVNTMPYTGGGASASVTDNTPLFAVISAGRNGVFETSCAQDAFNGVLKGDDEFYVVTYGNRGSFDVKGMEGYPECTNSLPRWTGTAWECAPIKLDIDGDGTATDAENDTVNRMVNCAKCGHIDCTGYPNSAVGYVYSQSSEACIKSDGSAVAEPACPRIDAWIDNKWIPVGRAIYKLSGKENEGQWDIVLDKPAQKFRLVEDEPEISRIKWIKGDGELGLKNIITMPASDFGATDGSQHEFKFSKPVKKLETYGYYDYLDKKQDTGQ